MTISSETRKAGPYTGNGLTTSFSFAFKVFAAADLLVVRTDLSLLETTLTLNTDYSVTLNSNQDANPGGTVTLPSALTTGFLLTLSSQVGALQATDLTNQGGFYPSVLNTALDKLTILVQQLKEQVGRAVKVNISSSTTPDQLINALYIASSSATTSASAAAGSATSASTSATNASNSATAAAGSASSASTSATNAAAAVTAAIGVTVQAYDINTAKTNQVQSFTKAQRGSVVAITYASTMTPDFATSNNFSIAMTGNATLANPTNLVAGQSGVITISQDATGSRTLAYGSYFKFASGAAPTLSTSANAVDDFAYYVESSTRIVAKLIGAVA